MRDALFRHMTVVGQLTEYQHGFRPGRSCATQLLSTLEEWTWLIEEGELVDVAYLDFLHAFDSVPHRCLLQKLHNMGDRGPLLEWLLSFLTEKAKGHWQWQLLRLGRSQQRYPAGHSFGKSALHLFCQLPTWLHRAHASSPLMIQRCTSEQAQRSAAEGSSRIWTPWRPGLRSGSCCPTHPSAQCFTWAAKTCGRST